MRNSGAGATVSPGDAEPSSSIVFQEYLTQEEFDALVADQKVRGSTSDLSQLAFAVQTALRPEDLATTRLMLTGDLVASVNAREDRTGRPFAIERGSGTVAAKTMRPSADGTVDILVPVWWVLPVEETDEEASERRAYLLHIAAHEVIHATVFHVGNEPFDLHHRETLPWAMSNFVAMASEQAEEYLAEYLGAQATGRRPSQNATSVKANIDAWRVTLATDLPAQDPEAPDYFERGVLITFESLHIVWKSLAYLAASLRSDAGHECVPADIIALDEWTEYIEPWWPGYIELLHRIPMTVEQDIPATDQIVREMAEHLQTWADAIGFDFHDTDQGAFFRIKLWD